jgi:aspartyl-tRNA(Asn)/glutamyl-tRNA(Gln) amidotransferase subunit C
MEYGRSGLSGGPGECYFRRASGPPPTAWTRLSRFTPSPATENAMSLDKETVRKIAFLARIRVPEDALEGLAGELNHIIGWVEQLNEVKTDGVEPMTSVAEMTMIQRDDVVSDGGMAADVLRNAPDPVEAGDGGGYFAVPKVVE